MSDDSNATPPADPDDSHSQSEPDPKPDSDPRSEPAAVPPDPRLLAGRRIRPRTLVAGAAVLILALAVGAFVVGRSTGEADSKYSASDRPLRVFASVTPHTEILTYVNDKLADGAFKLKIIEETDGVNGNDVVEHGDADASYFEHVPYLNSDTKDKGYTDLTVAATVHIEPYGIYSTKYKKLDDVPHHALVLLSNNVSNFARGLYLLQSAGLITLDHSQGDTSPQALAITEKNIVDNPRHLQFKQVEPAQIPRSLPDADLGLVNGNVALEAGLSPARDAIKLESGVDNPYANILVVPKALKNDKRVTQLSKILEGPKVAEFIKRKYPGSVLPVGKSGT